MTRLFALALLAGSLAACSTTPPQPQPTAPSASSAAQTANQPTGHSGAGATGTASAAPAPTGENARFPVQVTLDAVGPASAAGEQDVQLVLDVNLPPAFPLLVTVTPPGGAQLVSGQPQETLTISQKGRITRVFRVKGTLTPQAPLLVVVHGEAADRSSGIHADKKFPVAAPGPGPQLGPPPPGGRPPSGPPRR